MEARTSTVLPVTPRQPSQAVDLGHNADVLDLVDKLFVLMRTLGAFGPGHPQAVHSAESLAEAIGTMGPPIALQFVREAMFCNRQLLPLDVESFAKATQLSRALDHLGVHELNFDQAVPPSVLVELGIVLARGSAGPSDLLQKARLPGVSWRELVGASWGTDSRRIDPDLFAVTHMALAVQSAELLCQTDAPWDWIRGVALVRRLERAMSVDVHAAQRALEFVPQPWSHGRRVVAMASRVIAVLQRLGVRAPVLRSVGHAAVFLGCCGLGEVPAPLQSSAQTAIQRALPSVGKSLLGAARHQIHVLEVLNAVARRPATQTTWQGPIGVLDLILQLETRRQAAALANLTLADVLAQAVPDVGTQLEPQWFLALLATVGTLPPGARVRLTDGRVGLVLGPGRGDDPWRPQVLVGQTVVQPNYPVRLVAHIGGPRA